MSRGTLSQVELQRYHRQMILPEIRPSGQTKLKEARVLVVGAGGLGCPVLTYLAAAGVGTLKIADADLIDGSNLHRQPLYCEAAVGKPKVEEALRVLRANNSKINFVPILSRVDAGNIREILTDVEIVVDGSDNFATKYLLNDACVEMGKVLVSGSIFCFEGQVSVFNAPLNGQTRGPTYRCLFPQPPAAGLIPSCTQAGVIGVLPGVIGTLQATEVLKLILGLGDGLSGRLLIFDALLMSFSEFSFIRNDELIEQTAIQPSSYYSALDLNCSAVIRGISPSELRQKLARNEDIVLIDVREPNEKQEFDLGGDLIPIGDLLSNVHRIPRDRSVVLYCQSGLRSQRGIAALNTEFGFTNLLNLDGGVLAWQIKGDGHLC